MKTLVELVKESVTFQFYRDGSLYYKTESGFMFAVPISDTGTGTFKSSDKGLMFMRWIRKAHLEVIEEIKEGETITTGEYQAQPDKDQAPYIPQNMQGDGYRG